MPVDDVDPLDGVEPLDGVDPLDGVVPHDEIYSYFVFLVSSGIVQASVNQ